MMARVTWSNEACNSLIFDFYSREARDPSTAVPMHAGDVSPLRRFPRHLTRLFISETTCLTSLPQGNNRGDPIRRMLGVSFSIERGRGGLVIEKLGQ